MEEGMLDVSTEVRGQIDTIKMKKDTAVETLITPLSHIITTGQLTGTS
jgi:hypothetical protein